MKISSKKGKIAGTIVCIHGNSSSSKVFKNLLQTEKINHSIITVDLPGHGASIEEYKYHKDFSISFFKRKLIDYISTINDDILLIGNSLGGHLALEISPQINNLKGLVIFGTPPVKKPINFEEAFIPLAALQTFFSENPPKQEVEEAAKVAVVDINDTKIIVNDFISSNPKVRKCVTEDIMNENMLDEYEIYKSLAIPKFIIAGDKDPTVNLNYLKSLNESSKQSRLIEVTNCGHYPSLEQPNKFIEILKKITDKVFI